MKKILLTGMAIVLSVSLFSQFTDNFDSYIVGTGLVAQNPLDWDTWTPSTPGEDVLISNANSSSGANSLYFSSTGGGPEDIILRYASVYTSGNFTLDMNMMVENNKGAYFNMQETWSVGAVWAIDCFMLDNGTLKLSNSGGNLLTTTYPTGSWFNLRIEIDLTANIWELFIDNVSQGTFANPTGSIGILDLYPTNPPSEGGNDVSGFYVDDVSYDHVPASLPAVNGGVTLVSQINGLAGQSFPVDATVRNMGTNDITSFDITYDYNGTPVLESVGPVTITSLSTYNHTFATPVTLVAGSMPLDVTISNVNGAGADANPSDDTKSITISPVVPATGKVVFGEEATGTWCSWCPRGAVYMDYMETTYAGFWAGAAVHNNDPMADPTYDTGLGAFIGGYPSSLVDRGPEQDPSTMEPTFLQRIVIPPTAFITNGATYNSTTRELEVSVTCDFQSAASGDWRVGVVLTEDGVTGTGAGWDQANSYAGGGNGVMGGYELLPNPVPASQMVYDHVARTIVPDFDGLVNSFPSSINVGDTFTNCFSFILPATWDDTKIHVVSFLRNPSGTMDNAATETIANAVSNGLANCAVGIVTDLSNEDNFKLFPNPTSGVTYIDITNTDNSNVNVKVMDMSGKLVSQRDYDVNGAMQLPIVTYGLDKGIYIVTLTVGDVVQQQKLVVQ
jgi:hypothetical protein